MPRTEKVVDHMAELEDQEPTLELINKEISDALSRQTTARTQVDTKAAIIAGIAATATQFLARGTNPAPVVVFAAAAYILYGITFLTALGSYAIARVLDVPEPRGLVVECVELSKAETLARLVATRVEAYEANRRAQRRKVILWWTSVAALTFGLAMASLAIALAPAQ